MKARHIILYVAAVLGLTACSDTLFEDGTRRPADGESRRLEGRILQSTTPRQTRALMIDNPGTSVTLKWQQGDQIGVFGSKMGNNVPYTIAGNDISNGGRTASFETQYDGTAGDLLAYFPYDASARLEADGNLQLSLPATQQYAEEDYVARPEAAYSLMAARGDTKQGVVFRNVLALLKIGLVSPDENQPRRVRRVTFRDLDGKPVSGAFTVTWNGDEPTATFSGGGTTLTLDCGEDGVLVDTLRTCPFFLSVPARTYPKGFELTFELTDGSSFSKTVGTTAGKTLLRSVVYPIGDFAQENFEGCSSTLMPNARYVDAELMDQITGYQVSYHSDGFMWDSELYTASGNKDFAKDQILLFPPSEVFPYGNAVKVKSVDEGISQNVVRITQCEDFAEAYKEIKIGEPCWNDDGTFIEGKALTLNLNKYLQKIVLPDGEEVYFDRDGDEISLELPYDPDEDPNLSAEMTRSVRMDETFSTPTLRLKMGKEGSGTYVKGKASLNMAAKVDFGAKMVLNAEDGALHYAGLSIHPVIKAQCKFDAQGEFKAESGDKYLFTAVFGGLVIAGVPVTFECDFYASVTLHGNMELKGTITYQKTLSAFGFSYIKGDGFTGRSNFQQPDENEGFRIPEVGLTGSIGMTGTITPAPKIHVYGLFDVGVRAPMSMDFTVSGEWQKGGASNGLKATLTPSIALEPFVYTLGGLYTKTFKDFASHQFNPIWERWLTPQIEKINLQPVYQYLPEDEVSGTAIGDTNTGSASKGYASLPESYAHQTASGEWSYAPRTGITGIEYSMTVSRKLMKEVNLGIAIYEGEVSWDKFWEKDENAQYYISNKDYNLWEYETCGGINQNGVLVRSVNRELLNPRFVTILPITSYLSAGDKDNATLTLKGTVNYPFVNGQGYGMEVVAYYGDESSSMRVPYNPIDLNQWGYTNIGLCPIICNWPNKTDGTPWPK